VTKVVVIGGTGLIGSKVVARLAEHGHEAIAASPKSGVNTLTGEGLAEVLAGAQVVVDVSNSPSFETKAALDFFTTSTGNLLAAERTAGVGHHVALSVVGTERLSESGYFRAKLAQENLIKESGIPYSIVHATQFFEFVKSIADSATDGNTVRLSPALIQPIAADAVASAVARTAVGEPINGTIEIAGPQQFGLDELIRKGLSFRGDPREVVADPQARYYGALLEERMLLPSADALTLDPRFEDWLVQTASCRCADRLSVALRGDTVLSGFEGAEVDGEPVSGPRQPPDDDPRGQRRRRLQAIDRGRSVRRRLPQRQDRADGGWPSLLPRAPAGKVGMGRRFDPAGDLHG
jgi:uncharacterized protein YbjT (DUF2867 family)